MTDVSALDLAGWAARYAASGLAVLPLHSIRNGGCTCGGTACNSPGKHPLTRNGKDDATTDLTQVTSWWDRWPWANIGIRPPAGVIVLDIDPRNGGDTALEQLTRQHATLPPTLTARTGGGGLHIWLVYAGRVRGQLCRGVDVKTKRGYVVAPPSLHASGRQDASTSGRWSCQRRRLRTGWGACLTRRRRRCTAPRTLAAVIVTLG